MPKNKKIKESSMVVAIKGYLAGTKASASKKKSKKETPWYLKSFGQLKEEVIKELSLLREATDEEIEQRRRELEKEMLRTRAEFEKDKMDLRKEMAMNSAERAYNNFVSLSPKEKKGYEKYSINPQQTREIEQKQKDKDVSELKPRRDVNPEALQFISEIDPEDLKVIDRSVSDSIFSILDKYMGAKPTREKEYQNIKNFVENVFYKEFGGKVGKYIKEKSQTHRNISLGDIKDEKLQTEIVDEMISNKIRPINKSFQDWTLLSAPLQAKIKNYYNENTKELNHKIRKEFAKVKLPTMSVSANIKRTQRHNPYTASKQKEDEDSGQQLIQLAPGVHKRVKK